jgi:hypothetical protein
MAGFTKQMQSINWKDKITGRMAERGLVTEDPYTPLRLVTVKSCSHGGTYSHYTELSKHNPQYARQYAFKSVKDRLSINDKAGHSRPYTP